MSGFTSRIVMNKTAISRRIKRQVQPKIEDALTQLIGIFPELFGGAKTGRVYRRARGTHQASAAGEPPAIDTRTLLQSITEPTFPAPNIGQIRITAPYARALEFGTARVAARPFARPAVKLLIERRRRKGGRF